MTFFRQAGLFAALGVVAAPAAAAPASFQDIDLLEARVLATLGTGLGQPGGPARPIDRRLKLAPCPSSPALSMTNPTSAMVECEALGWKIHIPLVKAAVTMAAAAVSALVIRKGDQVEVVAHGGGFSVSTLGIALADGAPGERIRVKSEGKAAPFTAEVEESGRVVVARF